MPLPVNGRPLSPQRSASGRARRAGAEEAVAALLEHQTGQAAGPAGAGVDADAIEAHRRLGLDGMAVHDDLAEVAPRAQERLADPQQIVGALLVERHARAHAGVDEQIVAGLVAQLEALEELGVRARQALAQLGLQLLVVPASTHRRRSRTP